MASISLSSSCLLSGGSEAKTSCLSLSNSSKAAFLQWFFSSAIQPAEGLPSSAQRAYFEEPSGAQAGNPTFTPFCDYPVVPFVAPEGDECRGILKSSA